MKAIAIDRAEATVPWFAARDAHMRSEVSKHTYTHIHLLNVRKQMLLSLH